MFEHPRVAQLILMRPGGHRRLHRSTIPTGATSAALSPLHSLRHRRRSLLRFPYASFFPPSAFLLCSLARCLRGSMNPKTMTAPGVAVRDHESLEKKKAAIRSAGPGKLQVQLFLFLLNPSALEPFSGSQMLDLLDECETLR